jgi:RNA polymerase sigma factor (sigma-70 family)
MNPDSELLRRYAKEGNETAFAEVVRRHTDLVYSAALRIVRDAALAQDVTQSVFTKLARMAGALGGYPTPIGWLHTTTRHTAINAVRAETRRRAREHEAFTMQSISSTPDANWEQLRPILDEAVGQLRERDRQAVLLRFFNGLSFQEVGAVIGLTEDSAQKCVDRALEKLRVWFARRGVTVSSALLATAMSANSVQAAPVGLAADVAKASTLSVGSGASLGSALLIAFYMSTKIKTFVAAVVIALIMGGLWWFIRPMVAAPGKTAQTTQTTTPTKADVLKLAIPVAQVEPPKLPAVTPKTESVPLSDPNAKSQAELNTVFADMARLYRAGDTAGFMQTYTEPDKLDPKQLEIEKETDKDLDLRQVTDESDRERILLVQQLYDDKAKSYEELINQTPIFNAAGDEATYTFIPYDSYSLMAKGYKGRLY